MIVAFVLLVGLVFFLFEKSIVKKQRIENLPEPERALERVRIKEKEDREIKERMHSINTWNSIELIIGIVVLIVVVLIECFKI